MKLLADAKIADLDMPFGGYGFHKDVLGRSVNCLHLIKLVLDHVPRV